LTELDQYDKLYYVDRDNRVKDTYMKILISEEKLNIIGFKDKSMMMYSMAMCGFFGRGGPPM
jgi:hypothetical protein